MPKSYSLAGLAWDLGLPGAVGTAALAVVAVVGCAAIVPGRPDADGRGRRVLPRDRDRTRGVRSWVHYLILLYVPLALASPRLSWFWAC